MCVLEEEDYDLIVYAQGRTPYGGRPWAEPSEENIDIQCAGVLVKPGDVLVGDDDGVVVVPSWWAKTCIDWVETHEEVEAEIKNKILERSGYSEVFDDNNTLDGSNYSDYNQIKDAVHAKLRNQ